MIGEPVRAVVIDATSIELRRALGATAWAVFEEMLLGSTVSNGECVASVSVRSLAASLGLAKDTVGRAVGRLRLAGIVTDMQSRAKNGAFATGSYRLTIPNSITVLASPATHRAVRKSRSSDVQLAFAIDS